MAMLQYSFGSLLWSVAYDNLVIRKEEAIPSLNGSPSWLRRPRTGRPHGFAASRGQRGRGRVGGFCPAARTDRREPALCHPAGTSLGRVRAPGPRLGRGRVRRQRRGRRQATRSRRTCAISCGAASGRSGTRWWRCSPRRPCSARSSPWAR